MRSTSDLMRQAAAAFLAALSAEQRARTVLPFDDDERYNWFFFPVPRRGITLKDLAPGQRQLADALIATGYSPAGAMRAHTIMSLEDILLEEERERAAQMIRSIGSSRNMAVAELILREGHEPVWSHVRNPNLYFLTIFGEPAADRTWGWRLDGHHVCLNVTLPDGRLGSATPSFFGANPAEIRGGPRAGLRALAAEEDLARELVRSLSESERRQTVIADDAPDDILTFNHRRAEAPEQAGISAADLTSSGRDRLWALLEEYSSAMPEEIAATRMAAVRATAPDSLRFAWMGGIEPGVRHYYRIQSPTFLVEYDNTQNDANHIHSVWRELTGDFGGDLLGGHLAAAHSLAR